MARIIGKAGAYLSDKMVCRRQRSFLTSSIFLTVAGITIGLAAGHFLSRSVGLIVVLAFFIALLIMFQRANRDLDKLQKGRQTEERGAAGEVAVASMLRELPDSYVVIHDVEMGAGNFDHVAIGPKGVFIIDAKSWRGTVTANPSGELVLNDVPRPCIKKFVFNVMRVREEMGERHCFYQGLFVFTAAHVNAKWGSTSTVFCIRSEKLLAFILSYRSKQLLDADSISRIAQKFTNLAGSDSA